jgi:hypothetical protein
MNAFTPAFRLGQVVKFTGENEDTTNGHPTPFVVIGVRYAVHTKHGWIECSYDLQSGHMHAPDTPQEWVEPYGDTLPHEVKHLVIHPLQMVIIAMEGTINPCVVEEEPYAG